MSLMVSPWNGHCASYLDDGLIGDRTLISSHAVNPVVMKEKDRMPTLFHFCVWVYNTQLSTAIRESTWIFPIIEGVHTIGIVLVVGTISLFDLRLLGVILKDEPVSRLARLILPWTWSGFVVMFVTGLLLSLSEAAPNYYNLAFRLKLVLLALVGLNALIFHFTAFRSVAAWDLAKATPRGARIAAIGSLTLWSCIIIAGRMIAYLHTSALENFSH